MIDEQAPTQPSQKKFCFTCFGIVCFLILLLLLGVGSITAKAGIVKIPLLTSLFYKEPQEIIQPNLNAKTEITERLAELQNKSSQSGTESNNIELTITQGELLGLLTPEIQKSQSQIKSMQILIHKDMVELWIKLDTGQIKEDIFLGSLMQDSVWVKTFFTPKTTGEKVTFEIKKIQIGSLAIPSFLVNRVITIIQDKTDIKLSYNIQGIKSLELDEGQIVVNTTPDLLTQFESQFKQ